MPIVAIRLTEAEGYLLKVLCNSSISQSGWFRQRLLETAYKAGLLTRMECEKMRAHQRFAYVPKKQPRTDELRKLIDRACTMSMTTTGGGRGKKRNSQPDLFAEAEGLEPPAGGFDLA